MTENKELQDYKQRVKEAIDKVCNETATAVVAKLIKEEVGL